MSGELPPVLKFSDLLSTSHCRDYQTRARRPFVPAHVTTEGVAWQVVPPRRATNLRWGKVRAELSAVGVVLPVISPS